MADFILTIGSSTEASTVNSVGMGPNFLIVIASAPTRTIVFGDILTDFGSNDYLIISVSSQTSFTVTDYKSIGTDPVTGVGLTSRSDINLTNAEADIGNYAASGDTVEWRNYNDGTLDDVLDINDTTLGTGGKLTITSPVGERHSGSAGTGFTINPSTDGHLMQLSGGAGTPAIVVEFLELTGWSGVDQDAIRELSSETATKTTFRELIVHDDNGDPSQDGLVFAGANDRACDVINCVFYDIVVDSVLLGNSGRKSIRIYNSTIDGGTNGISANVLAAGDSIEVKNCAVFGATNNFNGVDDDFSGNNNATDDASITWGSNHQVNLTSSDEFVDLTDGSEDFRLKSTSNLRDSGIDLSLIFTRDVINNIRALNSDWDIGAFDWDEVSATIGSASGTGVTIDAVVGEAPEWTLTLSATAPADLIAGQKINDGTNDFLVRKSLGDILTVRRIDFTTVVDPVTGAATTARFYVDLSAAEADIGDIVEVGNGLTLLCMNDGTLTESGVTFNDPTIKNSGIFKVTSPLGERHTGIAGTGFNWQQTTDGTGIRVNYSSANEPIFTFEFIEIVGRIGTTVTTRAFDVDTESTIADNMRFSNLIIHDYAAVASSSHQLQGIALSGPQPNALIDNCLIYGFDTVNTSGAVRLISSGVAGSGGKVLNCTLERTKTFIRHTGDVDMLVQNVAAFNATDTGFVLGAGDDFDASSGNNASDEAEVDIPGGVGSNNIGLLTGSDQFKDLTDGSEDFRTKGGSALRDNGADLSLTFTKDIVSATRTLPFDIGAFQFIGAPGAWFNAVIC